MELMMRPDLHPFDKCLLNRTLTRLGYPAPYPEVTPNDWPSLDSWRNEATRE